MERPPVIALSITQTYTQSHSRHATRILKIFPLSL